ncbi:MAG: FixH family protein [Alphaproteobacteria bacterium]
MTGRTVLLLLVAFFGVMLLANGALIVTALESWSGVTGPKPYERGLAYNRTLEAAREQAALGWRVESNFESTGSRAGTLVIDVHDSAGAPIDRAAVRAFFIRPTQAGHDFDAALSPRGGGRYGAPLEFPLPGQWQVAVEISIGASVHRSGVRIQVP